MSYCRWSSMNFQCDLYCYESDTYTTHVAGRRRIGDWGESPYEAVIERGEQIPEDFDARVKEYHRRLNDAELIDIDLPHAGETFHDATLEAFRDRLTMLREIGYKFPTYVFSVIEEEIKERDARDRQS